MRNSVDIGKIIKKERTKQGMQQKEFADKLGIHKSTLSKYESGQRKIPMEDIGEMANVLGMSVEELLLDQSNIVELPTRKIPVLSKVSAGMPIYAEENIIDYTYLTGIDAEKDKNYFGLIVAGDSMNNEFRENDIVVVEKDATIENGQVGVVMVNGYNATLKRVRYSDDHIVLMPDSSNSDHEPQFYNKEDDIKMIGKVVGLNRKY